MSLRSLVLAAFALAVPAAAQQTRVSTRTQALPDSVVELSKTLEQLTQSQRMLVMEIERANVALRRASNGTERESARARLAGLYDRMERTIGELDMLQSHLLAMCASRPGPDGWLGVNLTEEVNVSTSPTSASFGFKRYPIIVSVEPDSPADKAGLASGDEIVTLGEHDMVSGAVDVAALLKPGARLPVRYRRDGAIKSITVLVEPRPEGFMSACPWIEVTMGPPVLAMQPKVRILRSKPNGFGFVFVDSGVAAGAMPRTQTRVEVVSPNARARTPELPPTPYAPARLAGVIGGNTVVGGAVLIPLTADAREGLGINDGILVIDVLRGSPAREAGLRAGDVIVAVKGRKVTSIPQLMLRLDSVRDGVWELKVTRRNQKPRIVLLRPQ
ncbi:MAG TPA: PDZ domain-containing protein [Gemmatimonadaceae bacterium]|nr:PDZ domain-containing protein [Gemmatimonadaceae bacterium]